MARPLSDFYDTLAEYYHLIFDNWDEAIDRQAKILNSLLKSQVSQASLNILDCACGIGTQALGFARSGHRVVASDISPNAVARARREATRMGVSARFYVSDMTTLAEIPEAGFDVVAAFDNALPHLTHEQVGKALQAISSKLNSGGLFIASIRDYDQLHVERPIVQKPVFYGHGPVRRIVHQIWDWADGTQYTVHLYITIRQEGAWISHHFAAEYRCLLRSELSTALEHAGFEHVRWVMPDESGFYQPIVLARKPWSA